MTITVAVFGVLFAGVAVGLAAAGGYVLATGNPPPRLSLGLEFSPRALGSVLIILSLSALVSSISALVHRPLDGSLRIAGLVLLGLGMIVRWTAGYQQAGR